MSTVGTLKLEKPVGMLSKTIKISDYRALFASIAKTILGTATLQFDLAYESIIDAIAALGIANSEDELAWVLINRSMMKAISNLVFENRTQIKINSEEDFFEKTDKLFADNEIIIDKAFFDNPKSNKIVTEMQSLLQNWLEQINVSSIIAKSIIHRLPSFFVYQLYEEWRQNGTQYKNIENLFDNPFLKATQREREWEMYSAYLEKQINESIFGEVFGLSQIFIPLCAYYVEKKRKESGFNSVEKQLIVVDLEKYIEDWLAKNDRKDAIKVISGGPGSGKSSFAKILSANLSVNHNILYIPLHLIDLKSDFGEAIGNFVKLNGFFTDNPYETEEKLIIIFDGLDELIQQGKACTEVAKLFIEEVDRHIKSKNSQKTCLQAIITGRELVVQANEPCFRIDGTILHVLPYYVSDKGQKEYIDENQLLKEDKRDVWWANYGNLTGHGYKSLPAELENDKLDEITSHPLLNYLVAMSYDRKKISFTENTNLNTVYSDLVNAVYERGYAEDIHKSLKGITEEQFNRVLEEIAISAWHGTGRTTTVKEIQEHCENSNMLELLEQFQEGAQAGVTNLLTAFYFRQSGLNTSGEKTFEFTHKSFCEYLLSKRIVRQLNISAKMLSREKNDDFYAWSKTDILRNWLVLCGKSSLDSYSFRFLCDEIRLQNKETVEMWQNALCELIEYLLKNGMPFDAIGVRPRFLEETKQSRNAEEALLATLSACSRFTGILSHIKWEEKTSAGTWIYKLQEQRLLPNVFVLNCLNNLDLSDCALYIKDFYEANLSNSDLSHANLLHANLIDANLSNSNLNSSDFYEANLKRANLRKADLRKAILRKAILRGAKLEGAKLEGADLEGADLREADLRRAKLEGAKLEGAKLEGALIDENNLKYCRTHGAILTD